MKPVVRIGRQLAFDTKLQPVGKAVFELVHHGFAAAQSEVVLEFEFVGFDDRAADLQIIGFAWPARHKPSEAESNEKGASASHLQCLALAQQDDAHPSRCYSPGCRCGVAARRSVAAGGGCPASRIRLPMTISVAR